METSLPPDRRRGTGGYRFFVIPGTERGGACDPPHTKAIKDVDGGVLFDTGVVVVIVRS